MPCRQRGVGLIEVLVALLVLAVGFLASGRMQVQSLHESQSAYHRSQARLLLDDMMDRMRNNPRGVEAGGYDAKDTTATVDTDCVSRFCTGAELAAHDLHVWGRSLDPGSGRAVLLPRGSDGAAARGSIEALGDGVYRVALSWEALVDGAPVEETASALFVPRSRP